MNFELIVTVHCDADAGIDRAEVLTALEKDLGGSFLYRAEHEHGDLSVTAHLVADDADLAQGQGEHLVSEALSRVGVARGTRVTGTEIRSGG